MEKKEAAPRYRILSFDGGGLRGLLSLELMRRISEKTKNPAWYRDGQFYAGTSTGGLIALSIANGADLETIKKFYTEDGPKIFNRRTWFYVTSFLRSLHIGYKRDGLVENLRKMFGVKRLADLEKKVLLVSFDLNKEEEETGRFLWQPKVIHNFKPFADDMPIVDAGLCTSAAPTYLPSFGSFIDGGVCANNPSMCALAQVMNETGDAEEVQLENVVLISFGTGNQPAPIPVRNLKWGIFRWNTKLLKLLGDGGLKMVDYQCKRVLKKDQYRRIDVNLKKRIELDDVKKLDEIVEIAAAVPEAQIAEWATWIDEHW